MASAAKPAAPKAAAPKAAAPKAAAAKAAPDEERDETEEEAAEAKPKPARFSRRMLMIMIGGGLGTALVGGGVTYLLVPKHAAHSRPAAAAADAPAAAATAPDKGAADADAAPADGGDKPAVKAALYLELNPAFVVNLADEEAMRFLQINVEIMARDSTVIDATKDHMPRIRNALMLLFSQQKAHEISSREAKEALQQKALEEVQSALKAESAPSAVEAVYFTSFVIQ
ncbi:MAG: flagellar basal body-associated FliL family protein [Nevskia sp.]|nr:flagellar basal body-associated FliL family protein [Nevskia sp.]